MLNIFLSLSAFKSKFLRNFSLRGFVSYESQLGLHGDFNRLETYR